MLKSANNSGGEGTKKIHVIGRVNSKPSHLSSIDAGRAWSSKILVFVRYNEGGITLLIDNAPRAQGGSFPIGCVAVAHEFRGISCAKLWRKTISNQVYPRSDICYKLLLECLQLTGISLKCLALDDHAAGCPICVRCISTSSIGPVHAVDCAVKFGWRNKI